MAPLLRLAALTVGAAIVVVTRWPADPLWASAFLVGGLVGAMVLVPQAWRPAPRPWAARVGAVCLVATAMVPPAPLPILPGVPPVVVPLAVLVLLSLALPHRPLAGGRRRLTRPDLRTALILAALAAVPLLWLNAARILPDRIASAFELSVLLGPIFAAAFLAAAILAIGWILRAAQSVGRAPAPTSEPATSPEVKEPATAPS